MKKVLSVMLAAMMLASLFAVNAGAMVIEPTYKVIEGAHDEIVYIEQDFSDAEKTDFTLRNYDGNANVGEDGVLHLSANKAHSQYADAYSTTAVDSGEFVMEFDFMRNDDLKADYGIRVIFNRAANADSENPSLVKYGIFIPVRTFGMYVDENGVRYEDATNPAVDIEAKKWYTYRITVSESAFIAAGGNGEEKNHLVKLIKAERKEKDGTVWTELPYTTTGNNFLANTSRAYGLKICGDNVINAQDGSEVILVTDVCPNAQGVKANGYVWDEATQKYVENKEIQYVEDGTLTDFQVDNIKIYSPANEGTEVVKNYPLVKGTVNLTKAEEVTLGAYAGGNANPVGVAFTNKLDALTEVGQKRFIEYIFDAINTVKGMPICIHVSGGNTAYGFDIMSRDEMVGKWYTYKVTAVESIKLDNKGNPTQSVGISTICRKPADGSGDWEVYKANFTSDLPEEEWSTAPVAGHWNNYDVTSAKFHVRGGLSSAANTLRLVWKASNEQFLDNDVTDKTATVWKFRNIQIVTEAYATGFAAVDDGVLNVDAKINVASAPATPVLAIYDADNRMVDADFATFEAGLGEVDFSADYAEGNTAKIFLWKNFEEGQAVCEPWDITANITK